MIDIMPPRSDSTQWTAESSISSNVVATSISQQRSSINLSTPHQTHTHQQQAAAHQTRHSTLTTDLLRIASSELESMRLPLSSPTNVDNSRAFPPACLRLLHSLSQQNHLCVDCHSSTDVTWASVSYGVTLCLRCSGRHRGLGVRVSYVKSLTMDSWNHAQVLSMLEGGNKQLSQFFNRHKMSTSDYSETNTPLDDRYKTKAASFYKQHLAKHAKEVLDGGIYMGREANREASKGRLKKGRKKGQQTLPTVEETK